MDEKEDNHGDSDRNGEGNGEEAIDYHVLPVGEQGESEAAGHQGDGGNDVARGSHWLKRKLAWGRGCFRVRSQILKPHRSSDLLLRIVLPLETNGVAETTDDVAVSVAEVSVVELALIVASVSVADVSGADVTVEAPSSTVVETSVVELGEAASVVGEASSCRAIGRTTPAKATLRHKRRARKVHNHPDALAALIFATRGCIAVSHHYHFG